MNCHMLIIKNMQYFSSNQYYMLRYLVLFDL